jgi:hypothetical protein
MKLSAQRVMQPGTRTHAIHAFHYMHGSYVWEGAPPADLGPGTLHASQIILRPLGRNSVLTYLDIIAPDEVSTAKVLRAFTQVYEAGRAPPFRVTIGDCTFESNMIRAYQLAWRQEIVRLFDAAVSVRINLL